MEKLAVTSHSVKMVDIQHYAIMRNGQVVSRYKVVRVRSEENPVPDGTRHRYNCIPDTVDKGFK